MFPISKLKTLQTPFYYYDTDLLRATLRTINDEVAQHDNYVVHYAVKANANPEIWQIICEAGLGANTISGDEKEKVIESGFQQDRIVFAEVNKSDWEIHLALDENILYFKVEGIPELAIIDKSATERLH